MQEDKEVRVRDRARAGGAQETKMSAEQKDLQGPSQEEAQKIRDEVGLASEEVGAINQPKESKSKSRFRMPEKAISVAATIATAAGGVGLAATAEDALKNTPSPIIQEQRPDPKRDNPPQGVAFGNFGKVEQVGQVEQVVGRADAPQPVNKLDAPVGDAPVTEEPVPAPPIEGPKNVVTTIHIPAMFKGAARPPYQAQEVKEPETPLYLREFGSPERGVTMRNKVEQGGGNLAYVEMGDQELWNNLMDLRETYGAKDEGGRPLKIEITYYSSRFLWERNRSGGEVIVYWYDVWAGNPGIYKNGVQEFIYRETDKTLDFRITLPEPLPGKVPTLDSVNKMHRDFMQNLRSVFLSQENGKLTPGFGLRGSPEHSDMLNHPVVIGAEPPNIFNVSRSALWIKLE